MFQSCRTVFLNTVWLQSKTQLRCMSQENVLWKREAKASRNQLFNAEKKRQKSALGRIEKINIECKMAGYKVNLVMNKNISTPYDCARHITEGLMQTSVVALYNDMIWDMHDPLTEDGEVQFMNILNPIHMEINKTYWRSCSFLLGAVLDTAFKSKVNVHLHSFPPPSIQLGCFSHYAMIDLPQWIPLRGELTALSAEFVKLAQKNLEFEKLIVAEDVALDMFRDNPYKVEQIPIIAKKNGNITLYRLGDHIDISKGPLIGNTYIIDRVTIAGGAKVSKIDNIYSFQGVSLPKGMMLNSFAFSILEKNAEKVRPMWSNIVNTNEYLSHSGAEQGRITMAN